MESNQEFDAAPQELAPGHHETLEELRRELTAWCEARPAAASLDIAAAYDELRCLDIEQKSWLPRVVPERVVLDEFYNAPPRSAPSPEVVLWDAKIAVVGSAFQHRQQQLRSRTLDLSRDRLRPLKFTDLPSEILRIIFDQFQDDAVENSGMWYRDVAWARYFQDRRFEPDRNRQPTVCRLRLVCRLFCELATPLLFPILHVQLSQASLDFVEMISKRPAIAAGVRGIHVSLAYRPKEHADSLVRYMDTRLAALQRHERYFNYEVNIRRDPTPDEDDEDGEDDEDDQNDEDDEDNEDDQNDENDQENEAEQEDQSDEDEEAETTKMMQQALHNCRRLRYEWREYVRAVIRGETPGQPLSEYQEILKRGHAEFRRLHQEQWQLLQNGAFSNALASVVARMPNARSFVFVDEFDQDPGYDEKICLNSTDMLSRFMATPLTWAEAEDRRGEADGAELPCVRLLWELPIALHQAGVTISELRIDSFPLYGNFSMLRARDQTGAPAWDELSAAFAELEVFDLDLPRGKWFRGNPAPNLYKSDVDNFLGAVLARCGRHLRVLELNFLGFTLSSSRGPRLDVQLYNVETIVAKLQELPRLRSLHLRHIDLQEKTLHRLCSGVGRHLASVFTSAVRLRNGLWADTIDVLRQKVLARGLRAQRRVLIGNLHGGEFDALASTASTPSDAEDLPNTAHRRHSALLEDLEQYVMGNLEHNPLRDSNKPWEMSLDMCTCAYGARYPCIMHI